MIWPEERAAYLNRRAADIVQGSDMTFTFMPSAAANALGYFSEGLHDELARYCPEPFRYVLPETEEGRHADIVMHTTSGKEEDAARIWRDRLERRPESLCALWLWDNHTWGMGNRQAAAAADLVFASHAYVSDYLVSPAALLVGHLPLCSAQWTCDEAARFFNEEAGRERAHCLLFNYVDYGPDYPERQRVIASLSTGLEPVDNLHMKRHDRSRYFSLSRQARFQEWLRYKATVIVPLDRDLSTRVFDALLAGLVLIVPEHIPDFDFVIPRPVQEQLGIIRVPDLELDTVQSATYAALRLFDEMGYEGALARHRFALENHMLVNRMTAVLETIWRIGSGELSIVFGEQEQRFGLLMKQAG